METIVRYTHRIGGELHNCYKNEKSAKLPLAFSASYSYNLVINNV